MPARRMRSMVRKSQACSSLRRCLATCHWLLRAWLRHEGGGQRKAHLYPRARWATSAYRANGYTVSPGGPCVPSTEFPRGVPGDRKILLPFASSSGPAAPQETPEDHPMLSPKRLPGDKKNPPRNLHRGTPLPAPTYRLPPSKMDPPTGSRRARWTDIAVSMPRQLHASPGSRVPGPKRWGVTVCQPGGCEAWIPKPRRASASGVASQLVTGFSGHGHGTMVGPRGKHICTRGPDGQPVHTAPTDTR